MMPRTSLFIKALFVFLISSILFLALASASNALDRDGTGILHRVTPAAGSTFGIFSVFPPSIDTTNSTLVIGLTNEESVTEHIALSYCIVSLFDWRTNARIAHSLMNHRVPLSGFRNQFSTIIKTPTSLPDRIIIDIEVYYKNLNQGHVVQRTPMATSFKFGNKSPMDFRHELVLHPVSIGQNFLSSSPRVELSGNIYKFVQPQIMITSLNRPENLGYIRLTPLSRYEYDIPSDGENWDYDPKCTINNAEMKSKFEIRPDSYGNSQVSLILPVDGQTSSNFFNNGTFAIMCNNDLNMEPFQLTSSQDEIDFSALSSNYFDPLYMTIEFLTADLASTGYALTIRTHTRQDYHQPVTLSFGFLDQSSVMCQMTVSYDGYDRFGPLDQVGFLFSNFLDLKGKPSMQIKVDIKDASDQLLGQLIDDVRPCEIPGKSESGYAYRGYCLQGTALGDIIRDHQRIGDQTLLDIQYQLDFSKVTMKNYAEFQCNLIYFHTFKSKKLLTADGTGSFYFTTGSPLKM